MSSLDPPARSRGARWALVAYALAVVACSILVMYLGRRLLFFLDEWDWILRRREPSLDGLLEPHVGHLSAIPVAIYQLFLWLFGLTHYGAFRALVLALHLLVGTLVFSYLRRRIDPTLALAGASVLVFYGSGWQDVLWPFQIGFLLSVAAGVAAFMLVPVGTVRADLGVSVCLMIGLGSSSLGIPLVAGLASALVLRNQWSRLWVVGAPTAVYGCWYLAYGKPESRVGGGVELARFVVEAAGAVVGSLAGVGSAAGQVLLVVVVPLVVIAGLRADRDRRAQLIGLATVPVVLWILLGISRSGLQPPNASRYLYPGAVFVLLLMAECVRPVHFSKLARAAVVVVAVWAVVWNVGEFRSGRDVLLEASNLARIDLGATDAGIRRVPGWYDPAARIPEVMLLYASAFEDLGSPVASVRQLAHGTAAERQRADAFLIRSVGLRASAPTEPGGRTPTAVQGPAHERHGPCLVFAGSGRSLEAELEPESRGLLIESLDQPVDVRVRNFADGYDPGQPPWSVVPGSRGRTVVLPKVAGRPWKLHIRTDGAVRVCGTAGRGPEGTN